jgi:vacuolar-type H+-ATPase subunit H
MTDQDVIRHLLEIEEQASGIVKDAETEAGRRVREADRDARTKFEADRAENLAALEADFGRETSLLRETYRHQMDAYRAELDTITPNRQAFSALAAEYLGLDAEAADVLR